MTNDVMTQPLLDRLQRGSFLLDGAMGSLLYERGVLHTRSYDELNVSQPELIRTIHHDYVRAGAELVETNTFRANRVALAKHGLIAGRRDPARDVRVDHGARGGDPDRVAGVYIMPPFNRVESALAVLDVVRDRLRLPALAS